MTNSHLPLQYYGSAIKVLSRPIHILVFFMRIIATDELCY